MANQSHVEIVKQGVGSWNAWRSDNPKVIPDLSGADLSGMNLAKINFRSANLNNANFANANLSGADLTGASTNAATGLTWQGVIGTA